jgi:hypothetical protein
MTLRVGTLILGIVVLALPQAGCRGRTTHQVSGRVQYQDGSPITGAVKTIYLEPAENTTAEIRKMATGEIAEDGTFTLYTRKPGDGVIPGIYLVVFNVMDKPLGGKLLIPEKYKNPAETPFDIVVDEDKTGLLYELEKL